MKENAINIPPKHTLKHITAAWQVQVRAAADKPWLFTLLMRQWARLFRRFAHFYQRLLALPRPHKRALKRRLATSLAGAALLLTLGQALPAHAATITVDGVTCTLAEAIISANNDNAAGNGCVDGSGADIIDLQTDVTLLTRSDELPFINSEITLEGNGHILDGNSNFTVLSVFPRGVVTLNNATITGGFGVEDGGAIDNFGVLTVNDSTLSGNWAEKGGGIRNDGTLTVNNSTLSGNEALWGGGISNTRFGTVHLNHSTLIGNTASANGGGIRNFGGTVMVNDSMLTGNTASSQIGIEDGGGIWNSGTLIVTDSSLSGNHADSGGGILNDSRGTVILNNSSLSRNFADHGHGGGIHNSGMFTVNDSTLSSNSSPHLYGGGIYNRKVLTVNNSTLSSNSAGQFGGGIINETSGTLTVSNSTLSGNTAGVGGGIANNGMATLNNTTLNSNSASGGGGLYNEGTLNLNRSLISGNQAPSGAEVFNRIAPNIIGTVIANNYNVIGYNNESRSVNFTPGSKDIIPLGMMDTVLDTALANNGGPTWTHALVLDSPAIDAAPSADCITPPFNADQRGRARNVNGKGGLTDNECDAGAFEFASEFRP